MTIDNRRQCVSDMHRLILPIPPSANRYWRNVRGRMVVSEEAKIYKRLVWLAARQERLPVATENDEIALTVVVHPRVRKNGSTRLSGDLDNRLKVVIDALQGVAYGDDRQVVGISIKRGDPVEGGSLAVCWEIVKWPDSLVSAIPERS
jgi:crossover junction endodeoxyribonuclease RusA